MNSALLLTNSPETLRLLEAALGSRTSFVSVPAPRDASREKFDALLTTWLRLVDIVVVDAASLGEATRWVVEALNGTPWAESHTVIVRLTGPQRLLYTFSKNWLLIGDTDSAEQLSQTLTTYLDLHEARARLSQIDAARPQPVLPPPVARSDSYRYRDALKTLALLLGQRHTESELLAEFLRLIRELLGVGKLAIFMRRYEGGLVTGESSLVGEQFSVASSTGMAQPVVEHLRLTLQTGIGGCLAREVRILRRGQTVDAGGRIEREFDLLGTEVAVPMFDNDQLLGVLTFSGKVTGEPLVNEELELVYQLLSQLAQAIRNLHLADRVASQQHLLGEVLANVHSGVLVADEKDLILALNDHARQLLDLGGENFVGQSLGRVTGRVTDVIYELLQNRGTTVDREVMLPRTNRPLRVRATRFEQTDTGRSVAVALVEDLTQVKLEQARQRELADREFLMRLAFRLSHELKNSVVAIKIFAQLLPERYNEKEFREQFSGVVATEVNRVDVLVNNLTFFSHPLALVHEEVVLGDLLEACLKNVGQEFARKQLVQVLGVGEKAPEGNAAVPVVTLKKNFGHKVAKLDGDKLRLMQAVEHLLRNALQSMPTGGRLAVSTSDAVATDFPDGKLPQCGAVKIEILDTGEGIPLENLKRVTEPFFTTRNVGVGLGLTIVKKIVERHCGRLEIDSLLGRGTTVGLVLPVKAQPHPEDALLEQLAKHASAADGLGEPAAPSRLPKSVRPEIGERS